MYSSLRKINVKIEELEKCIFVSSRFVNENSLLIIVKKNNDREESCAR